MSLASAIKDGVKTEKKVVEVYTTFRGREWAGQGELLGGSSLALELREDVRVDLRVVGMRSFYEERVDCKYNSMLGTSRLRGRSLIIVPVSPLSLLKNPMILIGIAGLAMVIGMPKLLANSTSLSP